MGQHETIAYDRDGAIATIILNRPALLNAMNSRMVGEIANAIEEISSDTAVRAVIIKGAGRAFCAGEDLKEAGGSTSPKTSSLQNRLRTGHYRIVTELMDLQKPVIASIHGYALGAGFDLALACDFRVAALDAKLGTAVVKRGLGGVGIFLLPLYVGLGRARELLYTGDTIDGREAERIGLVNEAVPADQLDEATHALARRMAAGPRSIGFIKAGINAAIGATYPRGFEQQIFSTLQLIHTDDAKEGRKAFLEKREPMFRGL